MNIHFILHADFENLGEIERWANESGHNLFGTHLHKHQELPENSNEFDLIISMGGPQNVTEIDKYNELQLELNYLRDAIHAGKQVLGICLGAQLISLALGGTTAKCKEKEIGEFPIFLTDEGRLDPVFSNFLQPFKAIHWHGEMAIVPPTCKILASTDICPAQAFVYGDKVYGLQFHLEFNTKTMNGMIENSLEDLEKGGSYVQSVPQLKQLDFTEHNTYMAALLTYLDKSIQQCMRRAHV